MFPIKHFLLQFTALQLFTRVNIDTFVILVIILVCQRVSQSVFIAIIVDNVVIITSDLTCGGVPWFWTLGLCG